MNRDEYKTPDSIFTFGEIDDFCKEWGWIHVKEFIPFFKDHKPPYFISCYGVGQFIGIDGNKYTTHNTFRTMDWWVPHDDEKRKTEFKKFLKIIAGDYYGPPSREYYYFYDVLMPGYDYEVFDAWRVKKDIEEGIVTSVPGDTGEPNEYALEHHGQKLYKVVLYHMGVSNGKMWGYAKGYETCSALYNLKMEK
jgi:hypothetical protein